MDPTYDVVAAMLGDRGAAGIEHPGGTLLAHLERVAARLYQLTGDDVLRLAALSHAVYGTDGFPTTLLDLSERSLLRNVAGSEVEELVYVYAACDRRKTWATLGQTRAVHDRWTDEIVHPVREMLRRFVDLSIINEVDVCERSAETRAKYGEILLRRFQTWQTIGSDSVLRDAYDALSHPV